MNNISFIYPYFDNPQMLRLQLDTWFSYKPLLREKLKFIIIDDCSTKYPARDVLLGDIPEKNYEPISEYKYNVDLYEIKTDIMWNQHGARNLGAHVLDGWGLFTDMDMIVPEITAEYMVSMELDKQNYYTFERERAWFKYPHRYHCNSFLIHKKAYWTTGGYDEDYCGTYGGDGPFKRILDKEITQKHLKLPLKYWGRTLIYDSGTSQEYRTDKSKNRYRSIMETKKRNVKPNNPLRFEWEKVDICWSKSNGN